MKFLAYALAFALGAPALAADAVRTIEIKTEKVGEVVHWKPDTLEVTQGETVKIVAKHDLEGGFDFHGLFIPELKITEKVDRHKPLTVEKKIPDTLKAGEYKVGCHFHPKHAPAKLVVKEKKADKKAEASKSAG